MGAWAGAAAVFSATGAEVDSGGVELQAAKTLVTASANIVFFMLFLKFKQGNLEASP
jgi:hypothetical protein